jgi:hypothetical protein
MIVQLPTPQELAPWIQKLESAPGSVVLIAVEQPEVCNFARCTAAWLSKEERKDLKAALEKARRKRALLSAHAMTTPKTNKKPATGI